MLRRLAKILISSVLWALDQAHAALRLLTGRGRPPRTVILYYHAVTRQERHRFARQMDLLVRKARPVTADLRALPSAPGLQAAVTFDDGFASVVENAVPELRSRSIPYMIFFPTGSWNHRPNWIRSPQHPSWTERVLSQDELRDLAQDPLVTIASHSINHPNFLRIDTQTAEREFRESRAELEQVLGRPIDLFSFPHGAHNAQLLDLARRAGYRGLYTVRPEPAQPAGPDFVAGRIATNPDDWEIEFRLKLAGAFRWQAWLSRPATPAAN
jgi:peptidoglycan/xylan/chitin deacetylase (PgdA/CDA1 family)